MSSQLQTLIAFGILASVVFLGLKKLLGTYLFCRVYSSLAQHYLRKGKVSRAMKYHALGRSKRCH